VARPLFNEEYDRERRNPRPGDAAYVHLKDLADALAPRLAMASGDWLDFGSGTSPYRAFAPRARLLRADVPDHSGVEPPDFVLEVGRPCPAEDSSFDGILSTQVLEHVPDAGFYLRDAHRMLRPGGDLLLTTHGIWEEHRYPIDVGRWTAEGLRRDVSAAGFDVVETVPLSCGVRGLLVLMSYELRKVRWRRKYLSPVGALLGALRLVFEYRPDWVDRFSDRFLAKQAIGADGEDVVYLDLLIHARKA
jgi:SAM-dependent methyltransferase